jgi:O-antigen/teichoic acid export membrane protein
MLARLLGPHAFGTYAVAYVALTALLTFDELGVSMAIVRWQSDPREIVPTVTTISMIVSVVIFVGCFLAAPAYTSAMGTPAATSVIRVLSILVLIDGFTNTPAALLQRSFRQGQRTIADQVNVWLGTGVTVTLAWTGHGAMSLAIGRVVGCLAGAILLAVFAPESLRLSVDPAKARALLRFGLPLAGANLLAFAVVSVDQIVVGHVLGAVALGFYVLALNLANWPISMFSQPVANVAPAVFSRLQHDRTAMRTSFLSAAGLLCSVAVPLCLLIGGSARPLVGFIYGARWLPAAGPLVWLALLGAVQIFFLLAYDYLVVLGRGRFLLTVQLGWLLAAVPALIAGSRADGIMGAGIAETAVAALGILPWYLRDLHKGGIRLRALAASLRLPVAGAALVGLIAAGMAQVAPGYFVALAVSGLAAAVVAGLLLRAKRSVLALLRSQAAAAAAAEPAQAAEAPAAEPVGASGVTAAPSSVAAAPSYVTAAPSYVTAAPSYVTAAPSYVTAAAPAARTDAEPAPTARIPAGAHAEVPASWDVLSYPAGRQDLGLTSPLYQMTIAALRWDPGHPPHRGPAGPAAGGAD